MNSDAFQCPLKTIEKEWSDDMRMDVLFAPFRDRNLNPVHYDSKMQFWSKAIVEWMREQNLLHVNARTLTETFRRKGKLPRCLDDVLLHLIRKGDFISRKSLMEGAAASYSSYFWSLMKLFTYPLYWVSDQSAKEASESIEESELIAVELLKSKALTIADLLNEELCHPLNNYVLSVDRFRKKAAEVGIQSKDVDIVIAYLVQQGRARMFVMDQSNKQVLKFAVATNARIGPLTEIENSAILLEDLEIKLEKEVDDLDGKIAELLDSIRRCLKENKKSTALRYLRQKKALELSRDKKEKTLANVQTMLQELEQTDSNKSVLEAYSIGSEALKKLARTGDLTIDKAEDIIDEMNETIGEQKDVTEALSKVVVTSNVDESDLEDELNELLKPEEIELRLPEVPAHPPSEAKPAEATEDEADADIAEELRKLRERINELGV